jgi:hypothetical protein
MNYRKFDPSSDEVFILHPPTSQESPTFCILLLQCVKSNRITVDNHRKEKAAVNTRAHSLPFILMQEMRKTPLTVAGAFDQTTSSPQIRVFERCDGQINLTNQTVINFL